jgi:hypothetical protein
VDRFSFFFAFYGLILGLAVTELLGGFAGMIRARAIRKLEPQTALLALLTFVIICAGWLDAWATMKTVTLNFAGLWAPILIGTAYYLVAAVIFPRDPAKYEELATYYSERKRFILSLLIIAELLVSVTYRSALVEQFTHRPAVFWLWSAPYKLAILGSFAGVWFARSRRANIAFLTTSLLLFMIPYWQRGNITEAISRHYGY